MKISSLIEIVAALHLTFYVNSNSPERGGLMLRGHPASLKTAVVSVLNEFPNAMLVSDLTVKQAAPLREHMISGKIVTLAFSELAKLYQRNSAGGANIEGFIQGIVAEGFLHMNWERQELSVRPARALVIGCMTNYLYQEHFSDWLDRGFARRFLWSHIALFDGGAVMEALMENRRLQFIERFSFKVPLQRNGIQYNVNREEAKELKHLIRFQPGQEMPFTLLAKTLSALKWKNPTKPERPMEIIRDFAESLTKEGAELHLKE